MTNSKALFMVQSPLHIHNAREAIIKFGITHPTFLVVTSKHNAKWAQMMIAALPVNANSLFCERNDFDLEGCTQGYAKHIPWLKEQAFDLVFFSDSRLYIFIDIVNSLQHPCTYLMDDGTGIIQTVESLKHTGKYFDITQSSSPTRQQAIEKVKKKYGLWQLTPVKYDLFTAFDFESCEQFKVVANPMSQIATHHPKTNPNQVLFLGQPLAKYGYITQDSYVAHVKAVRQFYSGMDFQYLAHPREDGSYLEELQDNDGVILVKTQLSVEQYLLQSSLPPSVLSSFFSAALWYVAKFQTGITVDAHRFNTECFTSDAQLRMSRSSHLSILDIFELIYDYYKLRMNLIEPMQSVTVNSSVATSHTT
ncbi:polysialyltransferase family glycosyltransferase [Aliiglaciecola litoralis]